jgi:hypothetical protein
MPSENGLMDAGWQLDWKTSFTADGEISANADGETFRATFQSSPLDMDWKIVGTGGSLTVPAGYFENVVQLERSIKIEVDSLQAVVRGQHVNVSTTLNLLTEMYYAPGVGLLKEEFTSASVRLFGMNFPISGSGSMELISYRIN